MGGSEASVRIDPRRGEAWVGERRVQLTAKEFRALSILDERRGELVAKDDFARAVWPENSGITSEQSIDKLISRLRRKLELEGSDQRHLITVRGRGYRLEGPPAPLATAISSRPSARTAARPILLGAVVVAALVVTLLWPRSPGTDLPLTVLSATMLVPGASDGPDAVMKGRPSSSFAPLESFALRVVYTEVVETQTATSVGPQIVKHMTQTPPNGIDTAFGACCWTAPREPGQYRLVLTAKSASGAAFTVELPYQVTSPQK